MKNPLNKRLPREFRKDFGKYLVIFLLLVITIGFVSGFLVADGSMIKAYNEGIDKYNTEKAKADAQLKEAKGYLDKALELNPNNANAKKLVDAIAATLK